VKVYVCGLSYSPGQKHETLSEKQQKHKRTGRGIAKVKEHLPNKHKAASNERERNYIQIIDAKVYNLNNSSCFS
jgi:hypothetical protein